MTRKRSKLKQRLVVLLSVTLIFLVTLTALKIADNYLTDTPEPQQVETDPTPDETISEEIEPDPEPDPEPEPEPQTKKEAKIMAVGDVLIHDLLYFSAQDPNTGVYDFNSQFEMIQPLISSADLAIANYEGSISPDYPLGGYPMFNAPPEIADAVKNAGFDVVSLANNHITDSRSEGIDSTYHTFNDLGVTPFGVNIQEDQPMVVKEVNGIKVALLAYAYGFNGMEQTLTYQEQQMKLEPIIEENIQADITQAQELADIIIVYPHMGVEYMLEPTQQQVDLYHKIVDWGADIVFGNHPHVLQPTEIIQKDGLDKFIIYSMGNFLSNQRIETLDNAWTERGVVMEVNISQENDEPVRIESIVAHPTWVYREPIHTHLIGGVHVPHQYHVLSTSQALAGQLDLELTQAHLERIQTAHDEVLQHLNIGPLTGGQDE